MDSPATFLNFLLTIISYGAVTVAIFKLFQIVTELGEIKELLKSGAHRAAAAGAVPESSSVVIGLESDSYAENLLRSVKAQEAAAVAQAPRSFEAMPAPPVSRPREESDLKLRLQTSNTRAQDDPWAPSESRATAQDPWGAPAQSSEPAETPAPLGKWSRELQRERHTTPQAEAPSAMPALAPQTESAGLASAQLSALSASMTETAPSQILTGLAPELVTAGSAADVPMSAATPHAAFPADSSAPVSSSAPTHLSPPPIHSLDATKTVPFAPPVPAPAASPAASRTQVWPEPTADELPSFQQARHQAIDWNTPLD